MIWSFLNPSFYYCLCSANVYLFIAITFGLIYHIFFDELSICSDFIF